MATNPSPGGNLDRYVVIHVATTCDEHGVYVTKDSAEVIELGWILLDAKTCDEVSPTFLLCNGISELPLCRLLAELVGCIHEAGMQLKCSRVQPLTGGEETQPATEESNESKERLVC